MLTFYRKEPFSIRAVYNGNVPYPDKTIGTLLLHYIFIVLFNLKKL